MQINAPNSSVLGAASGNYTDRSTQTGNENYAQSGQQTTTANNANTYAPGAQAVQGSASSLLQQILAGGSPPENFGLTQGAYDQYNRNFNQTVAHQLAAQFGAGSATIPMAQMQGLQDLAVESSQQAWNNLHGIFDDVEKIALNPTGSSSSTTQSNAQAGTSQTDQTGTGQGGYASQNTSIGDILAGIFSGLGGGFLP